MRISDWSSDVCSSDLGQRTTNAGKGRARRTLGGGAPVRPAVAGHPVPRRRRRRLTGAMDARTGTAGLAGTGAHPHPLGHDRRAADRVRTAAGRTAAPAARSEEHTSELQSLMRISYAVFCLKKQTYNIP